MKKQLLQSLRIYAVSLLVSCALGLGACVYKLDIQQGNILERGKIAQLKTGMTKRQVRFLLGTPLIIDAFNQDRWDYFYSMKDYSPDNHEGVFHQERVTLFFTKGQLSKIDNQMPVEAIAPAPDANKEKISEPEPEETSH